MLTSVYTLSNTALIPCGWLNLGWNNDRNSLNVHHLSGLFLESCPRRCSFFTLGTDKLRSLFKLSAVCFVLLSLKLCYKNKINLKLLICNTYISFRSKMEQANTLIYWTSMDAVRVIWEKFSFPGTGKAHGPFLPQRFLRCR